MLELKDVTVYYGSAMAVTDISLTQEEGTIISVIGANGAGKSTILKAINGLVRPRFGTVEFDGKRIDGSGTDTIVKAGIACVPESRKLFPYMSVQSNLMLGAYLRKDKQAIQQDLADVFALFPRLKERLKQKAGSLSGGEQQMLAIGRALMAKPKLLMMDEPSLGLAPIVIDAVADAILEINRGGVNVLLVEQNAGLVERVAQQCYVIEVGKIVLEGDIKELMSDDSVRRAFLG
ncbi:MAG: ABC transporter ATP-binding protein [Thermoleophilia bacterium]|nr:ABC transporter ATP-binding protein [Thermoleophilia bacterium]